MHSHFRKRPNFLPELKRDLRLHKLTNTPPTAGTHLSGGAVVGCFLFIHFSFWKPPAWFCQVSLNQQYLQTSRKSKTNTKEIQFPFPFSIPKDTFLHTSGNYLPTNYEQHLAQASSKTVNMLAGRDTRCLFKHTVSITNSQLFTLSHSKHNRMQVRHPKFSSLTLRI